MEQKDKDKIINEHYDYIINSVYKICLKFKIINQQDIEDVTQNVLLEIYKCLDKQDSSRANVKTWMYGVARNVAKSFLTSQKKNKKDITIFNSIKYEDKCFDKIVFDDFSEKLTDEEKQILKLRLHGYKYREIEDMLNITSGLANQKLHRLKKKYQNPLS